jgi:aspartyl aminopeptidase
MTQVHSDYLHDLMKFIGDSPTSFHAVRNICTLLADRGFTELKEQDDWQDLPGGSYYIRRNSSSVIIAVLGGRPKEAGLRMAGAHTDSPGLKIKPSPSRKTHSYLQLGVETYGGSLLTTWFDRDLSLAGRLTWQDRNHGIGSGLVDFKRPVGIIPSLAIHLDREANEKKSVNKQSDLVPIVMQAEDEKNPDFHAILLRQLNEEHPQAAAEKILAHELFLYDCCRPALLGMNNEFIAGSRLDNLVSCYTLVRSLLDCGAGQNSLVVLNDHEETGSMSTSGAQGNFLRSVLERIMPGLEKRKRALSRSLFLSADNAHGVHPNFADRHDSEHLPLLNRGPVIKFNANQRYATNSSTAAFFRQLCTRSEIPVQEFVMRSDLACGSTIGPLTAGLTGVPVADVGIPSLAMHSIRETAGALDAGHLYMACREFFALEPDDTIWQCLAG